MWLSVRSWSSAKWLNVSSWFLAWRLPSICPKLCCKEIQVSTKIRVLPYGSTLIFSGGVFYFEPSCTVIHSTFVNACFTTMRIQLQQGHITNPIFSATDTEASCHLHYGQIKTTTDWPLTVTVTCSSACASSEQLYIQDDGQRVFHWRSMIQQHQQPPVAGCQTGNGRRDPRRFMANEY